MAMSTVRHETIDDADAIARIYNEGIADRTATFETEPRTSRMIAAWFDGMHPVVVVEANGRVVAFALSSAYRERECHRQIAEFSVDVGRDDRGFGYWSLAMDGLIDAARSSGFTKLVSRVFPDNVASLALLRRLGFREVGIYMRHGQLDGIWKDVVIVEKILDVDNVGLSR
jgi:L-amino acid N-acyltransferase YncA